MLSYLAGLAQMAGIDLSHEVERKLAMRPTGSTVRTRKESWTERITLADGGPRLSILVPGL